MRKRFTAHLSWANNKSMKQHYHHSNRFIFVLILIISCLISECFASVPLALHQIIEVQPQEEVVLRLHGHDWDGHKTISIITSLPKTGTLHQLTYNYNKYGYDPKAGAEIISAPTQVKGSENRVVYKRPDYDTEYEYRGEWGRFNYTVEDNEGKSYDGTVVLVQPSLVIVGSDFLFSDEGWTTTGNRNSNTVIHDPTSRGQVLNHFIYAADDSLNVNQNGYDIDKWEFVFPEKYLGWQGIAYGGTLEFTLSSYGGDYSDVNEGYLQKKNLVEIHCGKCDMFRGITLGFPLSSTVGFSGETKTFSLTLDEHSGWLKDPKNVNFEWVKISKCDFIRVLSGISKMTILGDFTNWYETVIIDNVKLKASKPDGRYHLPICAQNTPDARLCSCK